MGKENHENLCSLNTRPMGNYLLEYKKNRNQQFFKRLLSSFDFSSLKSQFKYDSLHDLSNKIPLFSFQAMNFKRKKKQKKPLQKQKKTYSR